LEHLVRLFDRLKTPEVKSAFFLLVTEAYSSYGEILRPASQGAFSVLQFRPNGRYCFGFKGAQEWIRWYFRKPVFEDGLIKYAEVLSVFSNAEEVQNGEIAVNIHNVDEAKVVLEYLGRCLR